MRHFSFWLKLCIFNFVIVALLGTVMRYNIVFSLPWFRQDHLREAHSHFAFYGWVTSCIYLLVAHFLHHLEIRTTKYHYIMAANQIGSYGMLFAFTYGGYFWLSILFSSVALFTGFAYCLFLYRDTRGKTGPVLIWLRSGAFFAVLSSLGIFAVAYLSAHHNTVQDFHRAALYFYLHFQYNGFFIFSSIGLLLSGLKKYGIVISRKLNNTVFFLLLPAATLGYGLSLLWLPVSNIITALLAATATAQLGGVYILMKWIWKHRHKIAAQSRFVDRVLLYVVGGGFFLKCLLQLASALPVIGQFAFFSTALIIAYLHLVLLLTVSLYLIWKITLVKGYKENRYDAAVLWMVIFAISFNQLLLAVAGVFSIFQIPAAHLQVGLFVAAVMIAVALGLLFLNLNKSGLPENN